MSSRAANSRTGQVGAAAAIANAVHHAVGRRVRTLPITIEDLLRGQALLRGRPRPPVARARPPRWSRDSAGERSSQGALRYAREDREPEPVLRRGCPAPCAVRAVPAPPVLETGGGAGGVLPQRRARGALRARRRFRHHTDSPSGPVQRGASASRRGDGPDAATRMGDRPVRGGPRRGCDPRRGRGTGSGQGAGPVHGRVRDRFRAGRGAGRRRKRDLARGRTASGHGAGSWPGAVPPRMPHDRPGAGPRPGAAPHADRPGAGARPGAGLGARLVELHRRQHDRPPVQRRARRRILCADPPVGLDEDAPALR